MKTLIPMTDYLPEHPYSKFLKQRLEPHMFVPCDAEGNFLEEPNKTYYLHSTFEYEKAVEQYQKAKERVLFEGFTFIEETEDYYGFLEDKFYVFFIPKKRVKTIEDIIGKGFKLTQTAINQLNL